MWLVVEREIKGLIFKPAFRVETGDVRNVFGRFEDYREASHELHRVAEASCTAARENFWNGEKGLVGAIYGKTRGGPQLALYFEVVDETAVRLPGWCRKQLARLGAA